MVITFFFAVTKTCKKPQTFIHNYEFFDFQLQQKLFHHFQGNCQVHKTGSFQKTCA
jgi:hypothetical protein